MPHTVHREINLAALRHNLQQIRSLAPKSKVLAMVKANAYGHGLIPIAKALHDVDALGVARLQEALECRQAGISNHLVLMAGIFSPDELPMVEQLNCDLVVHQAWQVEALKNYKANKPIRVWLKINTGMNRLGLLPHEVSQAYAELIALDNIAKPIVFMTHFAESDNAQSNTTHKQFQLFKQTIAGLTGEVSCANSGAIFAFPETHGDWIRPGVSLYGASPFSQWTGKDHHLQPVMKVSSPLIAIHPIKVGEKVGYGGIWKCSEDMLLGIVAIGYGDGYPRHINNSASVWINGAICPIVGRVSMDMITIDLRPCVDAKVGDHVILWGPELPVEQVAKAADTISYELLTRMAPRQAVVEFV